MDKRISQEVEGDCLGDEFKGYIFRRVCCATTVCAFCSLTACLATERVAMVSARESPCAAASWVRTSAC
ncbi:hypothetical protein BLSTO_01927 [Blastocystis sp. subtype 1]